MIRRFGDLDANDEFVNRVLRLYKFGAETRISEAVWERANLTVQHDLLDDIIVRLELQLFGEATASAVETGYLEFPATWWQMLKRDHAPGWFLKRYPVKLTTYALEVRAEKFQAYPQAQVPIPEMGPPIFFYRISKRWLE